VVGAIKPWHIVVLLGLVMTALVVTAAIAGVVWAVSRSRRGGDRPGTSGTGTEPR
jgi:hypothetical protein